MGADTQTVLQEAEKFSPTALIHLYVIDASNIGGGIFRFSNDCLPDGTDIVWQGNTYARYPVKADGFEFSAKGQLPRPRLVFSNLFGTFTALNRGFNDLSRAKFIRKRCYFKNLPGQPQANSNAAYPDDVYSFFRKVSQNKQQVEYELASAMEIDGPYLPARQVYANLCVWKYRSAECGYADLPVADRNGTPPPVAPTTGRGTWIASASYVAGDFVTKILDPVTLRPRYYICITPCTGSLTEPPNSAYWFEDECSKRVRDGCKLRFGATATLPFGGFPGSALLSQGA